LRRNCLPKQVSEGKIEIRIEVTGKQEEGVRSRRMTLGKGEDTKNWKRKH
jgi:hypothetical protein